MPILILAHLSSDLLSGIYLFRFLSERALLKFRNLNFKFYIAPFPNVHTMSDDVLPVRGSVSYALATYAVRLAYSDFPLAPSFQRFVPYIVRSATLPFLINSFGYWQNTGSSAPVVLARVFRTARFSRSTTPFSVLDYRPRDSSLARYLYHLLEHADLFDRVSQYLGLYPYVPPRDLEYSMNDVFLVARPGFKNAYSSEPLMVDDPVLDPPWLSRFARRVVGGGRGET